MKTGIMLKIVIAFITIVALAFIVLGFVIAYEFGQPSTTFNIRIIGATVLYVGSLIGYYIFNKPLVFILINCAYIVLFIVIVLIFNNGVVLFYYLVPLVFGLNLGFSLMDFNLK